MKKLNLSLLILLLSISMIGFTGCKDPEPAHEHTFADSWSTSATHHWKAATCGHDVTDSKAEHSFGNWTVTKAATEEAEGSKERTCTVCEYTATEAIEKLAHTHKFATDWTKDENHHWHAATCEHTTEVSGKAEHSFGNWTTTKEPTEEAEGSKERTCTVCGYTATETIEKLAHTHKFATDWSKDETYHWHAATCGHDVTEGKAAHTFGDWTTTKEATEEAEGSRERSCTVCEYTATEVIAKLEHKHTYSEDWSKDGTYHWHAATCEHTTEVSCKAAHSFGNWTTTKEATEEEVGSKERVCSVCGYTATETIEKLAHTHKFATDWSKDETYHWHAATCGHDVTEGKAAHSFGDWTVTKEATEEETGTRERSCTVCGYKATEVIAKLPHTHKYSEDWTSDETYHWHAATCEHTTEVSGKAAHSFGNWTTTKEPTEEAEGSKERTCTVCGYTATETIEKLAHTHKFATDWSKDETYHWYAATCEHTTEVSDKAEHTFGIWKVETAPTSTTEGTSKRICSICNFEETKQIIAIPENFVLIPAGTFQMGSEKGFFDNKPVHQVTITKSFYMGKYEVTQAEYEKYCSYTGGKSPSSSYGDGDNYPAYYVSWYDALVYCNKRSMAEGLTPCYSISGNTDPGKWGTVPTSSDTTWKSVVCNWEANGYRLPTEAEWEYAARAGDNTVDSLTYSGTSDVNKLGEYAWYISNSSSKTHEVGTKKANAFGLYDMSGNVREWCWNWFTDSYDTGKEGGSDPTGTSAGADRVNRGGDWSCYSGSCAVSYPDCYYPYSRSSVLGFRVVRSAKTTD